MKHLYKLSILLFLLPALLVAGPEDGKYTKSKKISKTFNVNKNCLVAIQNEFGSVSITTWDSPTVSIDITVEVSGNNEDRVINQLKEIDVNFEASASKVSAVTDADHRSNNSGGLWNLLFGSDSNRSSNMKIDYIIKMPVTASLDLSNDYGAVSLDRLKGRATITCDFGRLDIGQLLAENNDLKFDYTNNSHIDYMKSGNIQADFSGFELYGAEKVTYEGDYTKATFHDVKVLDFNGDFSTLQIDELIELVGRGDYTTIKIGNISKLLNLNTDFGSISVEELGRDFKEVTIKSEYTGIKINYHPEASFRFDIDTEYSSIQLSDDLKVTSSESDNTDKQKSGYYGPKSSTAVINIRSSFGRVSLKKN
ncbi:hypothetical protein [Nonlabens sp.]|uniref:hypothetical protein n=1 Tax=Nonlabens sp. TaxID=1888209 RepID=UPI001BCEE6A0|nr:hypothetical protein [Nonlabens sp.]